MVADVTPIGIAKGKKKEPKPLMNPNVAIELGYAFGKIATDCFLPILNEAFGDVASLPFDIAHRRHPIVYCLQAKATKEQIAEQKEKLVDQLVIALKPYLIAPEQPTATPIFKQAEAKIGKAFYFSEGEIIIQLPRDNGDCTMSFRSVFYMRVVPRIPIDGHLDVRTLLQSARSYGSFDAPGGSLTRENQYGVIVATPAGTTQNLDAVLQYFRTGEIWGINATHLRYGGSGARKFFYTQPFEDTLVIGLREVFRFHEEVTHIPPPFYVEVGLVGAAGREIAHIGYAITSLQPKLASDTITHEAILHRMDGQTIVSFMMEFFEKVNKDSGVPRPKGLYGR